MFFANIINKLKTTVDETEQIEDRFYAQVANELERGLKDKAAYAKSIAQSKGNDAEAKSLYIKIRAKTLQKEFEKNSDIYQLFYSGYFNDVFKERFKENGFKTTTNYDILEKYGRFFFTKINADKMEYIITDEEGNIVKKFYFEEY
jgi:hypothetical protein